MEVRHINRSSSATRHPKVDTGANFEFESVPKAPPGPRSAATVQQRSQPNESHR